MFTDLTARYANGNNPHIKGRDTVVRNLCLTLLRHEKPNALLLGEQGVGKTSIIFQLAYLIANKLCPVDLHGFQLIEVNTNELISGDGYRGVIEQKFTNMIATAIKKGKVILFMDEFHTVQNLGKMANDSTPGLGNALKPYMTRGDFRIIGATTYDEFKHITDKALLRRMSIIEIGVPDDEAVKVIIGNSFARYIGGNQIKINPVVIDYVFDLSVTLPGNNPDKAKDIVDIVVANAKLSETSIITKSFVSSTFDMYFMKETKSADKAASDIFSLNSQDDAPDEFKTN